MSQHTSRAMSPQPATQPPTQPATQPNTFKNRVGNFYRKHPMLIGGGLGSLGTLGFMKFRKPIGKFMYHLGDYLGRVGSNAFKAIISTPYRNPNNNNYDTEHKNTVNDKND